MLGAGEKWDKPIGAPSDLEFSRSFAIRDQTAHFRNLLPILTPKTRQKRSKSRHFCSKRPQKAPKLLKSVPFFRAARATARPTPGIYPRFLGENLWFTQALPTEKNGPEQPAPTDLPRLPPGVRRAGRVGSEKMVPA